MARMTEAEIQAEVEKVWQEFWLPIVKPGWRIDMGQIKKELHEWYVAMQTFSHVYSHLTGGMLSKPLYEPFVYIGEIEQHFQGLCDEAVAEQVRPMPGDQVWMANDVAEIAGYGERFKEHGPARLYKIEQMENDKLNARIGWDNGFSCTVNYAYLRRMG